jgi:mannose-6-phosphate isomerase
MAAHRLRNPIRRYPWGSRTTLPELLGAPSPSSEPWAELWIGAHESAPSEVEIGGAWRSLRAWVEDRPARVLGERVLARFGAQLPFLLKVLAVEEPLSLQLHPDAARAAEGWAREEAARVPAGAPERRFPDANPKPELVCALGPFEALCAFRDTEEIRERTAALAAPRLAAVLADLARGAAPGEIFASLLRLPAPDQAALAAEVAARAGEARTADPPLLWLLRLAEKYPGDVACVAPLLLHHVRLAPGDALYLQPRDLHSYLHGTALEVMASSDNVIRAGLTPKPVDREGVLETLRREASAPPRVVPVPGGPGEIVYAPETEWFRLALLRSDGAAPVPCEVARGAELLLCLEGAGEIVTSDTASGVRFARGEAVCVTGETPRYEVRGRTTLARASAA